MVSEYDRIQKSICKSIDGILNNPLYNGRRWSKFKGDVIARLFKKQLYKVLPSKWTIAEPNAFIENFPTEFDLLIVQKNFLPVTNTNSYSGENVVMGIEIKSRGIISSRKDLKKTIDRIKNNFDEVKKVHENIDFIYIAYSEVGKPVRKNSINYLKKTKNGLKPYQVFCLRESRTKKLIKGEWERIMEYITTFERG